MATLILEDGRENTVTPANPKQGFTLAELYSALGCNVVEAVRLRDGRFLVIDENGKLVGLLVTAAEDVGLVALWQGLWGGRCLSLADYVTVTGLTEGRPRRRRPWTSGNSGPTPRFPLYSHLDFQ